MTGKEIKAQTLVALRRRQDFSSRTTWQNRERLSAEARAALAPCVVLTREEADEIAYCLSWFHAEGANYPPGTPAGDAVTRNLALLTPEEPS